MLVSAKKQPHNTLISSADTYTCCAFYCFWLLVSTIVLTCEMLHVYRQEALLENIFATRVKAQQNAIQIVMITLLSFSFTSPHVQLILHDMEFSDFLLRVLVYTFFVCFRVYTTTASMSLLHMSPIPARALLGWIVMIPTILVYIALCVPLLFHLVFFTASVGKKGVLPTHIPQINLAQDTTPPVLDFVDHSDIISKLKLIEKQQAIESHTSTSTKRRTVALF